MSSNADALGNRLRQLGPVATGGLGGSGTRIVAQILVSLGFFLGSDLNSSYDNLWFTFLFKRPKWFQYARKNEQTISRGLNILEKAMTGAFRPHPGELGFILRALLEAEQPNARLRRSRRIEWLLTHAGTMLRTKDMDYSAYIGWGWKEPNTHIYLEYLGEHFDTLKYIHVMRHGLDMAYSRNKRQLCNWGPLFGIDSAHSVKSRPDLALKYWIKANRRALRLGEQLGPERFLRIDFGNLCAAPRAEISRMISFLDLNIGKDTLDYVCTIPKTPESVGRYRYHSMSVFDPADIEAVSALGFPIG